MPKQKKKPMKKKKSIMQKMDSYVNKKRKKPAKSKGVYGARA